jgi:hypothetical protein
MNSSPLDAILQGWKLLPMRKWILWTLAGLVILCAAGVVALYLSAPRLKALARERGQLYLKAHLKSSVEFSDFDVSFYPRVRVTIDGLVLRHEGRTDIPPLIEIRRATFDAGIRSLFGHRHEISRVRLDGLQIHTPPHQPGGPPMIHGTDQDLNSKYPIKIDEIDANDALLVILRKPQDAGKPPNEFAIHKLAMYGFTFNNAASFDAYLTNPKPRGEIHCIGQFGPWQADDPSETPVYAKYTFDNADMSTLKGLHGTLSSTGRFGGPLDYLSVEGVTDIPDFALRTSTNPQPLHTDFTAIVDGTNGDVVLKKVTARLHNTTIVTHGEVVDVHPLVKGRTIALDATSNNGHIEDLLLLAVKTDKPVMTGLVNLKAKILIPERDEDLIERLILDGQFGINHIQFTNPNIQGKVDSLSRRGQGHPKEELSNASSELTGQFKERNAMITFSSLSYGVEGASIVLAGSYDMDKGTLDFKGKLNLDAKLSQTVTGFKSFLLRPVDPFFRGKHGGTEIPIKIGGTKDHPAFGLDFHDKANKRGATVGANVGANR